MIAIYLTSLMNFAYYSVFRSFISVSLGEVGQFNGVMLNHLKDFYFLVPGKLYFLAFIILAGIIGNSVLFYIMTSRKREKVLFNFSVMNLIEKKKARSVRWVLMIVGAFILVNMIAFGSASYLYNNPRDTWWNVRTQLSDLGFLGYFYGQVFANPEPELEKSEGRSFWNETVGVFDKLKNQQSLSPTELSLPKFDSTPNVIVIQLESIQNWSIDNSETPMPFLKSLMQENIVVEDFYPNSCQTINAEFTSLCSFWPNSTEPVSYSHKDNDYKCLPTVLKERHGYENYFFHSDYLEFWDRDTFLPKWGFNNIFDVPHYLLKEDDASVFRDSLRTLNKAREPFLGYVVTFNTHSPHNEDYKVYQYWTNNITINDFSGKIDSNILKTSNLSEEEIRTYWGFLKSTDEALEVFFDELRKYDYADNTVVVIYNDHRYYGFNEKLLSSELKTDLTDRSPFLIVTPDRQKGSLQTVSSHLDVAPTILNIIEGDSYEPVDHFIGSSMYSPAYVPNVLSKCLGQVYYKTPDLLIEGNATADSYEITSGKENLNSLQRENWLNLIGDLVESSDETIYGDQLLGK